MFAAISRHNYATDRFKSSPIWVHLVPFNARPESIMSSEDVLLKLFAVSLSLLATWMAFKASVKVNAKLESDVLKSDVLKSDTKKKHMDGDALQSAPIYSEIPLVSVDYKRPNTLKEMYFKLQNLEKHQYILPAARGLLVNLLCESTSKAARDPSHGILAVTHYTPSGLETFLHQVRCNVAQQWEAYLVKRRAGSPREMFKDVHEAKRLLEQTAPARCVDGAWLGHINRVTTPFALRHVTKDAWQVFSEELGDGDLKKHHVFIYNQLLTDIGSGLPSAHCIDFIHPRHGLDNINVWKAGVSQLLISLFPHEYLPEILGYNLHFEGITLSTLKLAHEVKEVKIDASYFLLHVTIDNADSGHSAIALQAIFKLLDTVKALHGDAAVQQTWRRIQAGYTLSEQCDFSLSSSPPASTKKQESFRNDLAEQVAGIFAAKARAANKLHCGCRMQIGRRHLEEWLEPEAMRDKLWQIEFLEALSNFRPLIKKGDAEDSKLIREVCWGGKMFGSFTYKEVEVLRQWIAELSDPQPEFYWSFTGRDKQSSASLGPGSTSEDIRLAYPVFSVVTQDPIEVPMFVDMDAEHLLPPVAKNNLSKWLPLWFTQQCLLECFVSVPSRSADVLHCAVVRLLRCQYGFGMERDIVDGMDEARRTDSVGIVDIGLELAQACGMKPPASLHEVLERWPCQFSLDMLHLSMRPIENRELLLGMMSGFLCLHDAIAASDLLSFETRNALMRLTLRERDGLEVCKKELAGDVIEFQNFTKGYALVHGQLWR